MSYNGVGGCMSGCLTSLYRLSEFVVVNSAKLLGVLIVVSGVVIWELLRWLVELVNNNKGTWNTASRPVKSKPHKRNASPMRKPETSRTRTFPLGAEQSDLYTYKREIEPVDNDRGLWMNAAKGAVGGLILGPLCLLCTMNSETQTDPGGVICGSIFFGAMISAGWYLFQHKSDVPAIPEQAPPRKSKRKYYPDLWREESTSDPIPPSPPAEGASGQDNTREKVKSDQLKERTASPYPDPYENFSFSHREMPDRGPNEILLDPQFDGLKEQFMYASLESVKKHRISVDVMFRESYRGPVLILPTVPADERGKLCVCIYLEKGLVAIEARDYFETIKLTNPVSSPNYHMRRTLIAYLRLVGISYWQEIQKTARHKHAERGQRASRVLSELSTGKIKPGKSKWLKMPES